MAVPVVLMVAPVVAVTWEDLAPQKAIRAVKVLRVILRDLLVAVAVLVAAVLPVVVDIMPAPVVAANCLTEVITAVAVAVAWLHMAALLAVMAVLVVAVMDLLDIHKAVPVGAIAAVAVAVVVPLGRQVTVLTAVPVVAESPLFGTQILSLRLLQRLDLQLTRFLVDIDSMCLLDLVLLLGNKSGNSSVISYSSI